MSAKFINSLLLTILISFTAPMLLFSAAWLSTWLFTHLPGLGSFGEIATNLLCQFLIAFGNGSPWQGMLVISLVCGFVGALFDTYAFYSFQSQRGN